MQVFQHVHKSRQVGRRAASVLHDLAVDFVESAGHLDAHLKYAKRLFAASFPERLMHILEVSHTFWNGCCGQLAVCWYLSSRSVVSICHDHAIMFILILMDLLHLDCCLYLPGVNLLTCSGGDGEGLENAIGLLLWPFAAALTLFAWHAGPSPKDE